MDTSSSSMRGRPAPRVLLILLLGVLLLFLLAGEATAAKPDSPPGKDKKKPPTDPPPDPPPIVQVDPQAFLPTLKFDYREDVFPVQGVAPPGFFDPGAASVEEALESVVRFAIGPDVTGTGVRGNTNEHNDQRPAVYYHPVAITEGPYSGWTVHEYWVYYAYNPPTHEHDWEAFFVYTDAGGVPQSARLSSHGNYPAYAWSGLQVVDGTHPVLGIDYLGHPFNPSAAGHTGVTIGWDGAVSQGSGQLISGSAGTFPWLIFSNDVTGEGIYPYTASPDVYYYGDPYFYWWTGYGFELVQPNDAPWRRSQWNNPPPPF